MRKKARMFSGYVQLLWTLCKQTCSRKEIKPYKQTSRLHSFCCPFFFFWPPQGWVSFAEILFLMLDNNRNVRFLFIFLCVWDCVSILRQVQGRRGGRWVESSCHCVAAWAVCSHVVCREGFYHVLCESLSRLSAVSYFMHKLCSWSGEQHQAIEMSPCSSPVSQWIIRKRHLDTAATTVTVSVVRPKVKLRTVLETRRPATALGKACCFPFGAFQPIAPGLMTSPPQF